MRGAVNSINKRDAQMEPKRHVIQRSYMNQEIVEYQKFRFSGPKYFKKDST